MLKIIKTAWLVTWDWTGTHADPNEDKVVTLFNYRLAPEKIKDFIERYYASRFYSEREKLSFMLDNTSNPYPARYNTYKGVPYTGQIHCGHNPFLYGRLVHNLEIINNTSGQEVLKWDEIDHVNLMKKYDNLLKE